jgi:hypothetical protein
MPTEVKRYFAGEEIPDIWIGYPWDAADIDEHNRKEREQRAQEART